MEPPVRPGDVLLGKYRIERVLGQGGMGIVAAARHLDLGELYAIKLLLPEALSMPQAIERFLREARASARLKGEHVAKVHDVGRLGSGAPYMVMEYLEGSDLKTMLRARGPLPVIDAVSLMLQACDALTEAHALGIVHRDLKPANLFLIRRPNGTPCIKVLDFGISKQLAADLGELTKSGQIIGTPAYMSPEQMLRPRDADPRSDLWAMGVILFELVTGKSPFRADSMAEVVGLVLREDPPPPSLLQPGLPGWIDAIVGRCLQKRPEHRFQSIAELAAALRSQGARAKASFHSTELMPSRPSPAPYPVTAFGSESEASTIKLPARAPLPSSPELPPQRESHAAPTGDVAIAGTHAVDRATHGSNTANTASGWGRTGARTRQARGPVQGPVIIAAMLGLLVSGAGTLWLFRGRAPAPEDTAKAQAAMLTPAADQPKTTPPPPAEPPPSGAPSVSPAAASATASPAARKPSPSAVPGSTKPPAPAATASSSTPSELVNPWSAKGSSSAPKAGPASPKATPPSSEKSRLGF